MSKPEQNPPRDDAPPDDGDGARLSAEALHVAREIDRLEPVARDVLLRAFRSELLRMRLRGRTRTETRAWAH